MEKFKFICLAIILVLFISLIGCSKPIIEGIVKDHIGDPIEGARIKILNSKFLATTNNNGKYLIDYAPGEFKVQISLFGW